MSDPDSAATASRDPLATASSSIDRRGFLKTGLAVGVAASFAEAVSAQTDRPPWMRTPGRPFSNYGQPSGHEPEAIRWIAANPSAAGNGISWTPLHRLEGTITPSGLHFERHHNGVPDIDPGKHELIVHGLVRQPIALDIASLLRYPLTSRIGFIECGGNSNAGWHDEPLQTVAGNLHGLVSCSEWCGVPLAIVLDEAGVLPQARWLIAEGADAAAMQVSLPIERIRDQAMLALYQNGERLRPENGYPLRLFIPGFEGVTQVKWLRRLELAAEPVMARNETAKYTELMPDGKARQFTFTMEVKSLITHPSPGHRLKGPGLQQISGLAWSGRGRIAKVEVSTDGGKSWFDAVLQEPVVSKAFTRFRAPWHWDGRPAVLQSRAVDETGALQPTRTQVLAERGKNAYFHYNAIVSWAVGADGSLQHVYA